MNCCRLAKSAPPPAFSAMTSRRWRSRCRTRQPGPRSGWSAEWAWPAGWSRRSASTWNRWIPTSPAGRPKSQFRERIEIRRVGTVDRNSRRSAAERIGGHHDRRGIARQIAERRGQRQRRCQGRGFDGNVQQARRRRAGDLSQRQRGRAAGAGEGGSGLGVHVNEPPVTFAPESRRWRQSRGCSR